MFYQIKDLTKKIQGLKFEKGKSLFVHSALHSFGVPKDINPTDFSYELLESLNKLTGNSGNIIAILSDGEKLIRHKSLSKCKYLDL